MREQSGELEVVGRPARDGDYVTIDLHGTRPDGDDLDVEDYLYEVGSGSDIAGLDDQLRGAKVGDILQFSRHLSDRPRGDDADAAAPEFSASFRVLVKEIKEKVLPEATDAWAAEASEFDTVAALRDDLAHQARPDQGHAGPDGPALQAPWRRWSTWSRTSPPKRSSTPRSVNGFTTWVTGSSRGTLP